MSITANFPNVFPSLELNFANSQQLDPRVTFSRSTTAPYYDGKTSVLAEQNLLLQSQFASNWTLSGGLSSLTLNATTSPDGTNTASQIIENANNTYHGIYQLALSGLSAGTYTVSCFAKAGTNAYLIFNLYDTTNRLASFNLSTGTLGTITSGGTGVITSFGNGWYRCSFTYTGTTGPNGTSLIIAMSNSDNLFSYTGNAGNYIYIWGAQLEQRSSVTAYNATTTTAITNYIPQLLTAPINAPRFDFNPTTGESLGLLIEQSSTNLLTYSQDFTNAAWSKARCSITPNADIAPDGTQTMSLLVEDTNTNSHPVYRTVTGFVSGTSYTETIYVKPYGRTQFNITFSNTAFPTTPYVTFDINAGTIVSAINGATGIITLVGNGVYRCTITATAGASGNGDVYIQPTVSGATNYTGNGYSGIYIWGAQLEALAFSTSYIPTTSAQVTRASDNASMTGTNFSSWYNQGQGTVYTEANYIGGSSASVNAYYSIDDGTTNNRLTTQIFSTNGFAVVTNNSIQANLVFSGSTINTFYKQASSYANNNFIFSLNGQTALTSSSGLVPNNLTTLNIGKTFNANYYLNGRMKKFAYYPQSTTATNVQALTGS